MADPIDHEALIQAAAEAHARAYAPYSRFKVGAALLGESGRIYKGCNVENVSYGLTSCAERNAIFGAVLEGERAFRAVAVVTGAETPTAPCGACRQVLVEFAQGGDMAVVLATLAGDRHVTTLSAIFPLSFREFSPTSE
ncbi:MAG TPA: cytidine deaminase [Chloroflexota bacterium]|nr:cytidine deaminase [Chloroflexota bacterium]